MRYAVFADIHGNLEALEAALEYARDHRLSRFMVLGDSIGYGANPNECLAWALQNAELHVLGNHEAAIIHEEIRKDFSGWAREAIDWVAERLRPEFIEKIRKLPFLKQERDVTLTHGTIHSPEKFHYLFDEIDAYKSFHSLATTIGLFGHSHVPCFFF